MTIKLKVFNHSIALPDDLDIPDGTEVEVSMPSATSVQAKEGFSFPTFRGNGPWPGIDLDDTSALLALLDEEKFRRQTE